MRKYNPINAPDPKIWLALDEQERLSLVRESHRKLTADLPNPEAHAAMHVIVENQIAEGEELPVESTLNRLMREGLDRHDAIHAVASVLIEHMQELRKNPEEGFDNAAYFRGLEQLTAQSWRESALNPPKVTFSTFQFQPTTSAV